MKRRKVIFAPEALEDLIALYDWIADAAGPATALGYIERLEAYCLGFDLASERGQAREDLSSGSACRRVRAAGDDRVFRG